MKTFNKITDHLVEWFWGPVCVSPEELKSRDTLRLNCWYDKIMEGIAREKAEGLWDHVLSPSRPASIERPVQKPRIILGLLGMLALPVVFIVLFVCLKLSGVI